MATEHPRSLATALADGSVRVVDLTQPLSETHARAAAPAAVRQHARACRARTISRFDDLGPAWAWRTLTVGEHVGTHFDAPIHWITGRDGEDVASVAPSKLVAPVAVIDKSAEAAEDPNYLLTLADIQAWENEHGPLPARRLAVPAHRLGRPRPRPGGVPQRRRRPRARTSRPRAGWPRSRRSSASASRPSAPTRASRTPSTRRSRSTTSCSAPASTGSPSSRTWPSCRRRARSSSSRR